MIAFSNLKSLYFIPISRFHTSKRILDKIIIPTRIKRGPTDILKALAGTVQKDKTRAAYQYHDDPYLTPTNKFNFKVYSLSKESGKKAARWVRDKHGDLFNHQPDDPVIKEYLPRPFIDEETGKFEANEHLLLDCLEHSLIPNAIKVYKECKAEEISKSTLQKLLESICFTNEGEIRDPFSIEEFHYQDSKKRTRAVLWKKRGVAEEIFELLKDSGSKAYCAIIRGMCKFNQCERAWELYQEAMDKDIALDSETVSYLIEISTILRDEKVHIWELVQEILGNMNKTRTLPSLSIMNSILFVLWDMQFWNKSSEIALQVLTEFKNHEIEPCLGSFSLILKIFDSSKSTHRTRRSNLLKNILDYLSDKELTPKSIHDSQFFVTAMIICLKTHDWEAASRLNKLLLTGQNFCFIGGPNTQVVYYRNYMKLCFEFLPLDEAIQTYEDHVPYTYFPENFVFQELVETIGVHDGVEHLPKVWSDIITLLPAFHINATLCGTILRVINKHDLESTSDQLKDRLCTIAWDIFKKMQEEGDSSKPREWTVEMVSDCLCTLARCKEDEKVMTVFNSMLKDYFSLEDFTTSYPLRLIFESANRLDNYDLCYKCLSILKEKKSASFDELFEQLKDKSVLTEKQLEVLQK